MMTNVFKGNAIEDDNKAFYSIIDKGRVNHCHMGGTAKSVPNQMFLFNPIGIQIVPILVWKYIGLSLSLDSGSYSPYLVYPDWGKVGVSENGFNDAK